MRVVFELRAGVQPMVVLNNLYKFTAMQSSFSANMLALVDGMPRVITLRQALQQFLEFRREVIRRRTEFELAKARQRAHILAGLRIAISNLDEVIQLIRNAESAQDAKRQLIARFGLDDDQSQAILDMQLRRLAALERQQLENEYNEAPRGDPQDGRAPSVRAQDTQRGQERASRPQEEARRRPPHRH